MMSTVESLVTVAVCVALALGALLVLSRTRASRPPDARGDAVGWHVGIVGTTYAVITAFMLSGVWANYQAASTNAAAEATALENLFHIAGGLPVPQRGQIQALTRTYADVVVRQEWPAMTHDRLSPAGGPVTQQLWDALLRVDARAPAEQASLQQAIEALRRLSEHRRVRELQSQSRIPWILWAVLLVGALTTVAASCTFDARSLRLHAFQVTTLALLIALVLVAIADIDRPFGGSVHVTPAGFELARATFDQAAPAAE